MADRLRVAWNFVQAKLHHAYPCGRCGYRYASQKTRVDLVGTCPRGDGPADPRIPVVG